MTDNLDMNTPGGNEPRLPGCDEPFNLVRKPRNIFDKISVSVFSIICFAMSIVLMLIISAATVMRYILQIDLYGYEEWVKIFAFWLYFMGAGFGAYAGTHVSADLVQAYLPDSLFKRFMIFLRTVVTVCVTLLFTWYGRDFFWFAFVGPLGTGVAIPKTVAWRIPLWTAYLSIFIGLLYMSYYFIRDMVDAAKALFFGGKSA